MLMVPRNGLPCCKPPMTSEFQRGSILQQAGLSSPRNMGGAEPQQQQSSLQSAHMQEGLLLVPSVVQHLCQVGEDLLGSELCAIVRAIVLCGQVLQHGQDGLEVRQLPAGPNDGAIVDLAQPVKRLVALCGTVAPCTGRLVRCRPCS